MSNSKLDMLKEISKKYGVTGKKTETKEITQTKNSGNVGQKVTSAPTSKLDMLKDISKKYGVTVKPAFNAGIKPIKTSNPVFTFDKAFGQYQYDQYKKAENKNATVSKYIPKGGQVSPDGKTVTIPTTMSEKERKARIKEIESKLYNVSMQLKGLSYGTLPGYADDAAKAKEKLDTEKDNLIAEKRQLERQGTFKMADVLQWRIDDLEYSKGTTSTVSPDTRMTAAQGEAYAASNKKNKEIDAEIATVSAYQSAYKQQDEFDKVNAYTVEITSKPDFEENSKYSPKKPKTEAELKKAGYKKRQDGTWYKEIGFLGMGGYENYTGEEDPLYTYINNETQRDKIDYANISQTTRTNVDGTLIYGTSVYDDKGYDLLTDDEIAAFNYLYNTQGKKKAEEYLEKISPFLDKRKAQKEADYYSDLAKENPVAMSIMSVGTNIQNAAMYPAKLIATASGEYDPVLDVYGNRTQAIRSGVSEDMSGWGKLFYNAGMSTLDFGTALAISGGNPYVTQAVMSSSAGSSAISEAKASGASDGKAFFMGLGSAAIEWATEKYSVDAILKKPSSIKGYLLQNTITEGVEEGVSNIGNTMLDAAISEIFNDRSSFEQRMDYLIAYEGKTSEAALQIAFKEKLMSIGEDILVGSISGFGMGGMFATGRGVANAIENNAKIRDTYVGNADNVETLIDEGKALGGKAATVAENIDPNNASFRDVNKLIKANDRAIKTADPIEEAAREVVAERNKEIDGEMLLEARRRGISTPAEFEAFSRMYKPVDNVKSVLGDGKKAVGTANGQAYISNGKIFIPVENVETVKTELGAVDSEKVGENVSQLLESSFSPINENYVDGKLKDIGNVRVYTDAEGREIAVTEDVAEYLEGYNLEATFKGGKPYAIKATDNEGKVKGVAMAVGLDRSGQQYELIEEEKTPYNVLSNENPLLQDRKIREAYIKKATGYGQYGVSAFADIMETVSESEAPAVAKSFNTAYEAGLTNLDTAQATLPTEVHRIAFNAGKQDFIMENVGKVKNVKNVKSHGDKAGFDSTNVPSKVSKQALDIADRFCKELGVKGSMTGESDRYNAHLTDNVGIVQVASDFKVLEHLGEDATSLSFLTHVLHEVADHRAEELAPTEYAEFKREMYNYKNSVEGVSLAEAKRQLYGERGVDISLSEAMSEVTANSILEMYDNDIKKLEKGLNRVLNGTNANAKKGANVFKQALDYVIEAFRKLLNKLGISKYNASLNEMTKIRDAFENMLGAAISKNAEIAKSSNLVTEKNGAIIDSNGNVVAQINEDGTATFSLKTFDDSGRAELKKWLDRNVKNKKLTQAEANEISEQLEYYYDICKEYEDKYAPFSAWSKAEVVKGLDGKPLMSVVKANGDYKMNLDFSLVCKKRRPLDALYRAMIDDGFMDNIGQLSEVEVARINEIIRKNGFETACTLCFVDSKRYRQYAVADSFVSKYNELVKMLAPEGAKIDRFDFSGKRQPSADGLHTMSNADLKSGINKLNKVIKEHGETTVVGKIAKHLKAVPQDRKLVMVSDFMDSEGFVRVKKANPEVFKLYNSSKGSGGPKATLPDVQYLGEILKRQNFTPKKAYAVGGVRVQSFSDYIPRLVFDYLQMTADLTAKRLPAHAYSKEDIFVMQFGKTGIKINMSLVPAVAKDGVAPGLDKDGNYVWVDGHTFASDFHDKGSGQRGFELAVKIQNTEGYSQNCGTIAVGVSDKHIVKMLKDNDIRMVIPYHKSSLNHFVAKMGNIDQYKDYTNVQNTRDRATGKKIEGKDFNFNEAFHRLGDAKEATNEYLAWCEKNNYIPKFDYFAFHEDAQVRENYYKVLIDFAAYDSDGNAIPQGAVTMNFPTENDAFGSMKSLIEKGLEADAILEGRKAENIPKILQEVKSVLGTETEGKKYSLKDSEGKTLTKEQAEYFKDSKVRDENGNLKVVYHGSKKDFTTFDMSALKDELGIFFAETSNGEYYGKEKAYYLSINNPLIVHQGKEYAEALVTGETQVEIRNRLIKEGYDGIKILYNKVGGGYVVDWVAFKPNQPKLTTNTNPTSNPDINYSLKGTEKDISLKDVPKVRKAVAQKNADVLAKYVDSGAISTEVYNQLIKEFGAIPKGEKPSRDISVPEKTAKDKKVSRTVRTILEAGVTPDEAVPTIEKMVEDGVFSYDVYGDKEAIANSEEYLQTHGWAESYKDWFEAVEKGEVSKDTTTMGWVLYNNAATKAATTTDADARKEAIKESLNILDAMVRHQRNAAQALQATRILKKLSPTSQLYAVQKSVEAIQNELINKYADKAPDLVIDEELVEKFLTAETEEARLDAEIEIYKDIGRQLPADWLDRWNAWRYLAMLGNLRTHIRNVAGNAGFAPVVAVKNIIATGIETLVAPAVRLSGRKMLRSKSIVWGSKSDRALLGAAWNDYANVAELVSNGGKYNDSAMANQHIEDGRKVLNNWKPKKKVLKPVSMVTNAIATPFEWMRKKNSKALELEDVWFSKPHYAFALAMYCKANNITAEQIKNGKAIAPAREYAIKEAQKATYKDTNAFSQFVSDLGRRGNKKNKWHRRAGYVIEGALPFRKTPANVLARGVEYSPIGFVSSLADIRKIGKEVDGRTITATEVIDGISAGLTGTGLLALGIYLASQGLIRGHGEDDEEARKFKEMQGHQSYSLELPSGESVTLDWLAPEALPFFVGVNIWERSKGVNEKVNMSTILQSVTGITEPMLKMSCLQGVNDMIESVGSAWSNDTSGLMSILASGTTSYLMQGVPTILGQAERTGETERMTTYTDKNDFLTGDMQYTLGKVSAKIPGWDYNQIPYIDAWGRREASGSALKRGGHNFLNPAYTSKIKSSEMENELLRLYEATNDEGVFPERAGKYFTVDKERKDLTADEYVRYATLKGEKSYNLVSELVESKAYKKLTDEEKVQAIKDAYNYANQKAKQAISNYKPQSWVEKADGFGSNKENYIAFRTSVNEYEKAHDDEISKQEVIGIINDMAENDDEKWKMYLSEFDSENARVAKKFGIEGGEYFEALQNLDKYDQPNKNGKLGTYTNDEVSAAVYMVKGLSNQDRAVLWQTMTGSESTKNNPWRAYLP